MKINNKHNLASFEERGENFIIDFIFSSILAVLIVYITCSNLISVLFVFFFIRFLYYFLLEYFFGRTLGKYETQTIVVNSENKRPSILQLIKRNLIRFISLIYAVGDDEKLIHDNFSNTLVVKNKKLKKTNLWRYNYLIQIPFYSYFLYRFLEEKTNLNIPQEIVLIIIIVGVLLILNSKKYFFLKKNTNFRT